MEIITPPICSNTGEKMKEILHGIEVLVTKHGGEVKPYEYSGCLRLGYDTASICVCVHLPYQDGDVIRREIVA